MTLKSCDDTQTRCETANHGAQNEMKIQPVFNPVKNPDLIGTLHHFQGVPSQFITPRNVDVWLPPDYDQGHVNGYAVLYMHDGQNLFESQKSYIGVDWGLDETMAALCLKREIRPTIVVGVWNTPQRLREYLPQRPFCDNQSPHLRSRVIKRYGGMPLSDNYLRFLVYELKPFVDSRYCTRPARECTLLMGSSMGGLISLYAICEYPHVFGGAGCLSTHWPIALRSFSTYLNASLPDPGRHKLYLDYGNEADNAGYRYKQKRVEHTLMEKGYKFGLDWFGSWYVGDPHSETAWRDRVHVPLRFLLKNDRQRSETTTKDPGNK